MTEPRGFHPGQGPDNRNLTGRAKAFVRNQIQAVDRLYPKAGRQYVDYDPRKYGEHEARRERRHGALSILSDQEALLEQALENHETLAQTRYRLTHAILSVRVTERHAIRYTGSQNTELLLDCDVRDLRYSLVSQPMCVCIPSAIPPAEHGSHASLSPVPRPSEARQPSQADEVAPSQAGGSQPRVTTQSRSYQKYPEINMVDNNLTDWWGYNDGVLSKPLARTSGEHVESSTINRPTPPQSEQ